MHRCNMCVYSRRLLQSTVNRQHDDDQSVLYFVCMNVANQSRLPQALVMVGCSSKKVHIDRLCMCVCVCAYAYMPEFRYVCVYSFWLSGRLLSRQMCPSARDSGPSTMTNRHNREKCVCMDVCAKCREIGVMGARIERRNKLGLWC